MIVFFDVFAVGGLVELQKPGAVRLKITAAPAFGVGVLYDLRSFFPK